VKRWLAEQSVYYCRREEPDRCQRVFEPATTGPLKFVEVVCSPHVADQQPARGREFLQAVEHCLTRIRE